MHSKTTTGFLCLLIFLTIQFTACSPDLPDDVAEAYAELPQTLDFNIHVKPILSDKCFACHGPDKANQKAGLQLDEGKFAFAELPENPGKYAINPGNLKKSEVFHRITSEDPEILMPTTESNLILTAKEKATLIKWIEDGAEYKPHWAFIKPENRKVPKVNNREWIKNPIDNFILKKLEEKNLQPNKEADKALLLRRLSFDLTGLPPTPEELEQFINDKSENAYEKQVDRLLNTVHYGEKMAIDWLDVARYSDTHGYLVDRYRDMSPWRDWVIQSFNENMPYDQFITWQLAGDLLPNPTREQILATGFNRLHPQNLEDGIIDEEFRVENVADRTAVLGQGLMALTLSCARCHDHKYDPISQKNYYEFFSFFNNINESGQIPWDWATPVPTLMIPDEEQEKILAFLEHEEQEKLAQTKRSLDQEQQAFEKWTENEAYQNLSFPKNPKNLVARFNLENTQLVNQINPAQKGKMGRQASNNEFPEFTKGLNGNGLLLNGDAWLDLDEVGIFQRHQPFTINLNIYLPESIKEGVIFHKGYGTYLHSFRGYHVTIKNNRLEILMAHTWPDNAIIEHTLDEIPKDKWINLALTYDGSSKASGLKIFLDGEELQTEVQTDNLYKDIIFHDFEDYIYSEPIEPGLQIGARWRGKGLKNAIVDDLLVFNREVTQLELMQISNPEKVKSILQKPKAQLNQGEKALLNEYFLNHFSKSYINSLKALEKARAVLVDSMENVQEIMVMKEMENKRKSFVLNRGQYDVYGEEVFPATPESIMPMKDDMPKNRLGLAQWLIHPDHPLTARVAVNRYWQNYFGKGLVKTTGDFGNQGELPSHPELLDWLALEFIHSGWDVKALQKLMVMSATYRQSAVCPKELREKDPENIWLARGPSARLTSEMIRDNALIASELLNRKVGGQSVYPYQPEGLWKMNNATYQQDTGDKLYRRSLYTIWKRTVPNPTLSTFDAPDRNECTVRRQKTNTPLQALVLLNDPTYIEAAKVIGEQMTANGNDKNSIENTFEKLTGRKPKEEEVGILMELRDKEYQNFKENPEKTLGWLEAGEYRVNEKLDSNWIAANAIVASVILNADASITKR
ncbi:DUF1553 domain-containing protein [Flexithrix dorotheae]|uniref:DUF1553 domain-containing protein n=1 Tax=Flexithrix dorotheae TaxID=70993 RepID=UPI00036965FC|nr:DUF1553 domain-containing protein [Flexithrix dorotheae]